MAFGIYVHIPYCVTKCPYCDFNSHGVGRGGFPEGKYAEALLRELSFYRERTGSETVTSVFFGGGTPSLFAPESIESVLSGIKQYANLESKAEITLEVNPATADTAKLRGFREAGVNRISTGIQSFSERKLAFLGRINSPADGYRIVDAIVSAGYENFNLDIMYGIKDETPEELESDLEKAVALSPRHISAYCLTIEDGTEFGKLYKKGMLDLPDDDRLSDLIGFTSGFLVSAGFGQYEISNYAMPEYECRHNLLYWRGEGWLGIGAGAHSHLSKTRSGNWGVRWGNVRSPSLYMNRVSGGEKPVEFTEYLNREESLEDYLLMALRLKEGLSLSEIRSRFDVSCGSGTFNDLIEHGFLRTNEGRISLTPKGALVSDELILRIAGRLC